MTGMKSHFLVEGSLLGALVLTTVFAFRAVGMESGAASPDQVVCPGDGQLDAEAGFVPAVEEAARDLAELLAIPSVSDDAVQVDRAIGWMRDWLEARGVWCAEEKSPEDGRRILYAATRKELKNPDYVLVTHLDVVEAPAAQFVPTRKGTRLFARGANDTKATAYAAARILARLNGKASVGCIFSANEEVGGSTTGHLVKLGYGVPGKMMLVFDGDGQPNVVRTACKGCAYYRVTATGRSGHASCPHEADNPIYRLARAALRIESEYPFQKPGEWGNVAAVTVIRGGDSRNRIPETAEMIVNIRFTEENGLERERAWLERVTGLKTELVRGSPAAVSREDDPEFLRLEAYLRTKRPDVPVKRIRGAGANDSRYFPQFGKPMVAFDGLRGAGSHSDCEYVDLASIAPYVDLVCGFIMESL